MDKETRENITNCLRTFGMIVLMHKDILDSDVDMCADMIERELDGSNK